MPDTIIEIYFNDAKKDLKPLIYDVARMISRLYAVLKDEFNIKLMLKNWYMGKLAHEINNWFPQVKQKIEGLEKLIGPEMPPDRLRQATQDLGFARVRLEYFSDIFETVIAEFRGEKYPLLKKTINLSEIMRQVKEAVIDLCVYDTNYRAHLVEIDALNIPASAEGDARLKEILQDKITLIQTDLTNYMNETLIFTCLQEMLRNAVLNQDWQSGAGFTLEAYTVGENRLAVRVTNTPLKDTPQRLVAYARSLVEDEAFQNEGFGTMWLKSIQNILNGRFQVSPKWLDENTPDYPPEFSLAFIIPRQTNNQENNNE